MTPAQYVQNILVGSGVTVSNIKYNGSAAAANTVQNTVASFTNSVGGFPMATGVVMTTGNANIAPGPNNTSGAYTNSGAIVSDPDLDALTGSSVTNGAVIEFDFMTTATNFEFQYIFGSEEYLYYVGSSFNDVFGFFLSGPGISGTYTNGAVNLAVVPGTSTPVSINTVNDVTNSGYYFDNPAGTTTAYGTSIQYNGTTVLMTVNYAVQCNQLYHMKLGICNVSDEGWDSGVFIKAGSFIAAPPVASAGPNQTVCGAAGTVVNLAGDVGSMSPLWTSSGSGTFSNASSVNSNYTISAADVAAGSVTLTLTGTNPCTGVSVSSTMTISFANPTVTVTPPASTICPGATVNLTGTTIANTTVRVPKVFTNSTATTIPNNSTGISSVIPVSGITPDNAATNPVLWVKVNITHPKISEVKVQLVSPSGGTITLKNGVSLGASGANMTNTVFLMSGSMSINAGTAPFTGNFIPVGNLNSLTGVINGNWTLKVIDAATNFIWDNTTNGTLTNWSISFNTDNSITSFAWSPTTNMTNSTTLTPTVSPAATTTYTLTATDAAGCTQSTSALVTVTPSSPPAFTNPGPICSGTAFTLPATSTNGITGTWSPAANNTATTTYTFTPTAGQCAVPTTMTVTVNPLITPTFTNPGPVCSGTSFTLPSTSNNSISGTWSPAVNNTATTTYTFTPTAGQCASTATMTVTVNPLITPTFTNPGPICSGTSFTLPATSDNSITGTWSPAANNTATTTYTFTPTAGQCATTATMTVTINPQIIPTFTNPGPLCYGTSFTLAATSDNSISGTWSPAANNTATTTYTFTPTAGQCATTATMTVVINPQTLPSFTQLGPYCEQTTPGVFSNTSTNGISGTWGPATISTASTGNSIYTFTPASGQCATTTTMTINVTAPDISPTFTQIPNQCQNATPPSLPTTSNNSISGTWSPAIVNTATAGSSAYTFTPTAGQCAVPTTMNVTVGSPATPVFTQIQPFCTGFTAPVLPTTSNDGFTGSWSPSTVDNQNDGTYTFTPASGQCATTSTMSIVLTPRANPVFSAQPSYCQGAAVTAIPNTSNDGYSGTWSPAWTNQVSTTYTFTPNNTECANPVQATITINTPATPNFAAPAAFCYGGTAPNLQTTSPNGIGGTWSPATIDNTVSGSYIFTPNSNECAVQQTVSSTVNPMPIFNVSSNSPLCPGMPLTLTSSATGINYNWSGPGGFASSQASPTISSVALTDAGTYNLQLTDANNCIATYSTTVTVDNTLTPTLQPIGPFCASETASQPLSADYAGGTWSGTGVSGTDFIPSQAGAGTFTLTYVHTVGCGGSNTMNVIVNPNPDATFNGDKLSGCEPVTVNFTSDPNSTATHWDFGDGNSSDDIGTTNHTYPNPGAYTVTVTVTENGCTSTSTETDYINVYPNPIASFTTDNQEMNLSSPTATFHNNSTNADSYSWTFGDGSGSSEEEPVHTYPEDVSDYLVILAASTIHQCVDTAKLTMRIKPELIIYVPNAFTPDGDEFNNTFYPVISGDFDREHYTMLIFNRWGEIIFESHNDEIGWDGTYHEKYVQEGVYTWTIKLKHKYDDKYESFVGSLSILK